MSRKLQRTFSGFSPETLKFLENLAANNSKPWFEKHRHEYEQFVLDPLRALVTDLSGFMMTIDPQLETRPAVNKTISRIYRDTRFSKDKSLFRNNMWIVFKRPGKDWKGAPGFFFEIFPDWYRYGMGFYSASPDTMRNYRRLIDQKPREFRKATAFLSRQKTFELAGELYKKVFDPVKPEAIQTWYQRRNLYLVSNHKINRRLFGTGIADELAKGFGTLAPLYHFLWTACAMR
ncbi:MAG: DUF2461 domain-containing protein [Candidatus Zixiibacteriota bacterium]|nr:MAG: DUF2461 domain-containing protein [candidate division Zixibacteria bacterium]